MHSLTLALRWKEPEAIACPFLVDAFREFCQQLFDSRRGAAQPQQTPEGPVWPSTVPTALRRLTELRFYLPTAMARSLKEDRLQEKLGSVGINAFLLPAKEFNLKAVNVVWLR